VLYRSVGTYEEEAMDTSTWNWDVAAKTIGVQRDGRFNAGAVHLPQDCALIWRRTDGDALRLSGAEFLAGAQRLASVLSKLGIRRGDRVAGILSRRPEALTLPMAVWQLGAIYVPRFSGFGSDAVRVRLEDSQTRLAVVDAPNRAALDDAEEALADLEVPTVDAGGGRDDHSLPALLERRALAVP
jgi:acetyl-CoA synthetase